MNIRKPTDYITMFTTLDTLMAAQLPQMELYREIGRVVSGRSEKGAAVAASEYLQAAYPTAEGFSPRNLRRMREFYAAYEESPEIIRLAMNLGWTQNVAILERCSSNEERAWYIRAVLRFGWKKAKLLDAIESQAWLHSSLDEQAVFVHAFLLIAHAVAVHRLKRLLFGKAVEFHKGFMQRWADELFQRLHRLVRIAVAVERKLRAFCDTLAVIDKGAV